MHILVDPDEWETAMGDGGALEAFIAARDEGLVRHLGVTGHGIHAPAMHLKSLVRFNFNSVLAPLNYIMMKNAAYAADFEQLAATCQSNDVALQTIKSISRGELGNETKKYDMWYAPLDKQQAIEHAVHWVLGHHQAFLNTPADITLLPLVLKAAENFSTQPSDECMESDIETFGISPLFS